MLQRVFLQHDADGNRELLYIFLPRWNHLDQVQDIAMPCGYYDWVATLQRPVIEKLLNAAYCGEDQIKRGPLVDNNKRVPIEHRVSLCEEHGDDQVELFPFIRIVDQMLQHVEKTQRALWTQVPVIGGIGMVESQLRTPGFVIVDGERAHVNPLQTSEVGEVVHVPETQPVVKSVVLMEAQQDVVRVPVHGISTCHHKLSGKTANDETVDGAVVLGVLGYVVLRYETRGMNGLDVLGHVRTQVNEEVGYFFGQFRRQTFDIKLRHIPKRSHYKLLGFGELTDFVARRRDSGRMFAIDWQSVDDISGIEHNHKGQGNSLEGDQDGDVSVVDRSVDKWTTETFDY